MSPDDHPIVELNCAEQAAIVFDERLTRLAHLHPVCNFLPWRPVRR
jgi:hypothetical protein